MRVLVIGGTRFIGRRIVERLHARGDEVLLVHRGVSQPNDWIPVRRLFTDRRDIARFANDIHDFAPEAIIDTCALNAADVATSLPALPEVPTVVLSSQDVYEAYSGLRAGRFVSPTPLTEESPLRSERYPYRGGGLAGIPDDYEKIDVERLWLERGACALRLPAVYGPFDPQRREDPILRRIRAGRARLPVGPGDLLWSRGHVDDIATGALDALVLPEAAGQALNIGEPDTVALLDWYAQIVSAAGGRLEFVPTETELLPPDLSLTAPAIQHLRCFVTRAEEVLGWNPRPAEERVAESVRWQLANPPTRTAADADFTADDVALG